MRTLLLMLSASFFSCTFAAPLPSCASPTPPVQVTPGLVVTCGNFAFSFNFGSDPLPDGGQIDVEGVDVFPLGIKPFESCGSCGIQLDLGFPVPSQRTTVLDYTFSSSPVEGFALTAQGSSFSINEKFVGSSLPDLDLNASGSVTLGCVLGQPCQGPIGFAGTVVTTITDNAGDLAGFSEMFVVPEPNTLQLLVGGLLFFGTLLQMKSWMEKPKGFEVTGAKTHALR